MSSDEKVLYRRRHYDPNEGAVYLEEEIEGPIEVVEELARRLGMKKRAPSDLPDAAAEAAAGADEADGEERPRWVQFAEFIQAKAYIPRFRNGPIPDFP